MQQEILLELFSLPIGLKKVVKVDDIELYTSDSLIKRFTAAIAENEILKNFSSQIARLVAAGKLTPCYVNRRLLKFLSWKVFSSLYEQHNYRYILAFFDTLTDKVYVIIDNNVSFFGFVSNKHLGRLIIHELCHMASAKPWRAFNKLFFKDLVIFYKNFFEDLFQIQNIDEKEVADYLSDILRIRKDAVNVDYHKAAKRVEKFINLLRKKYKVDPDGSVKNIFLYLYSVVVRRPPGFVSELIKHKFILVSLIRSYKKSFGFVYTGAFQELYEPSEVISVYSSKAAPKEKVMEMLSLIK